MRTYTFAALLALVAAVSAKPNGAPSCSLDGAADRIAGAMGANKGKIPCTFSSDKTSYTPGSKLTISWKCEDIDNFTGILLFASPANDKTKRVGAFTLLDGLKSNKGVCGEASEQENSAVTHSAPGQFAPTGSIEYTASATDFGNLHFNFIIMKKVDGGFRWTIAPDAIIVSAPGSAAEGANYGTVAGDEYNCNCPAASTVSLIRKCTPKTTATTKVFVTKTKTTTCTTTTTTTETSTSTLTETVSASCGAVAGGEETPTTTEGGYGGGYGGGYDSTPTTTGGYGGYGAYNVDEEDYDGDDEE